MAHLGRLGPWARFRDLIGSDPWDRQWQPFKYEFLAGLSFGGTLPPTMGGLIAEPALIEYDPPGPWFAYSWFGGSTFAGGPATLRVQFSFPDPGDHMRAVVNVHGDSIDAGAEVEWNNTGGYRLVRNSAMNTARVLPGYTTTNATIWNWAANTGANSCGMRLRGARWAEVP